MRVNVTTYLTLDGVMQSPGAPEEDTAGGFCQGGWQQPHPTSSLLDRNIGWIEQADGLLLGRRTYDIFASYWPTVSGDPIADRINPMPKYVVSTSLDKAEWEGTAVLGSLDALRELKNRPGGNLLVYGSGVLVGAMLDAGLVDELRLWTYPVVLGSGRRLFEPGRSATTWRLVESSAADSGCVLNVYRPAGEVRYGDMSKGD